MGGATYPVFFRETDPGAVARRERVQASPTEPFFQWFGELDFNGAAAWAFDLVSEEEVEALYWRLSYQELQRRIQRQYGEREATLLSQHNSIGMLLSQALGSGTSSSAPSAHDPDRVNVTQGAASVEDAVAAMNRMLRMG